MTEKLKTEFKKHLSDASFSRAGWDYQMSPEQRQKEAKLEKDAILAARSIWDENPDIRDELKSVFLSLSPLVTFSEIDGSR